MDSILNYISSFSWYRNNSNNKVFGLIENIVTQKHYWVCLGKRKSRLSELIPTYKYDGSKERLVNIDGNA